MRRIRTADLADTGRLLKLFEHAVLLRMAEDSEHGRLLFVSAAEQALSKGNDPPRLFAKIVREGLWLYVTAAAEAKAVKRLREWDEGQRGGAGGGVPVPVMRAIEDADEEGGAGVGVVGTLVGRPREGISRDGLMVWNAAQALAKRGITLTWAHAAQSKAFKDWTRERWQAALDEVNGGGG